MSRPALDTPRKLSALAALALAIAIAVTPVYASQLSNYLLRFSSAAQSAAYSASPQDICPDINLNKREEEILRLGIAYGYDYAISDGSSTRQNAASFSDKATETMVWIPTKGGKKYHKNSSCSNMKGPVQVTISEAKSRGYDACKRCKPPSN